MAHLTPIQSQLFALWQSQKDSLREWFLSETNKHEQPFYASVDLRHSGMKLAPVDTNLFPAGFNNLSLDGKRRAVEAIRDYRTRYFPQAVRVMLIPENHTRNLNYLDNVHVLMELLKESGFEVRLARSDLPPDAMESYVSASGNTLVCYGIERKGSKLFAAEFEPDLILVNNDFTSGVPDILKHLSQPLRPCPTMGWFRRRKSEHFSTYQKVSRRFSQVFGLDEWLISTYFEQCGMVNFAERTGLECVALAVEKTISRIRTKHTQYGIVSDPYVYVKADSGTYGMGIMTARSGDDIMDINKKTRNKMSVIKEGALNTEVMIQEGIPTLDLVGGAVAEPVIYLINSEPLGGAWRSNENRDPYVNLNASGMQFTPFNRDAEDPAFVAACLVSRIASLAAAEEQQEQKEDCRDARSPSHKAAL